MQSQCYIKVGADSHPGLDAAVLLTAVRQGQAVEVCFGGCPEADQKAMLALYYKWRQDSNQWTRRRPLIFAGLGALLLAGAYFSGYWQEIVKALTPTVDPNPAPAGALFADQASLYVFLVTIAAVLGIAVWFLRGLARREAGVGPDGVKIKDNELTRRLAKGYVVSLEDEKLVMAPK